MSLDNISCQKSFGGWHKRYRHHSKVLGCDMVFAVYLPPQAEQGAKLPVLYWLSGLTCTDENFMQKAGAQRLAAELGLIIVAPDTSPRGEQVPGDPDGAWDFGLGAGFYLNATQQPWAQHYRMHDYVVEELPALIEAHFPASDQRSISGHSMGGMAHWCVPCATRGATARYRRFRRSATRWIARGAKRPSAASWVTIVHAGASGMPVCCWRKRLQAAAHRCWWIRATVTTSSRSSSSPRRWSKRRAKVGMS